MKASWLIKAYKEYDYLLIRTSSNRVVGFNCKVSRLKSFTMPSGNCNGVIGYTPCSFNEYLNYKIPFIG